MENLPAERALVEIKEGVLLLQTEPGLVDGVGLHQLGARVAVVELVRGAVVVPALGEHEDVGLEAERVLRSHEEASAAVILGLAAPMRKRNREQGKNTYREDGDGAEVDIRVVARGLVRRGAVEVPDGQVLGGPLLLLEGLD